MLSWSGPVKVSKLNCIIQKKRPIFKSCLVIMQLLIRTAILNWLVLSLLDPVIKLLMLCWIQDHHGLGWHMTNVQHAMISKIKIGREQNSIHLDLVPLDKKHQNSPKLFTVKELWLDGTQRIRFVLLLVVLVYPLSLSTRSFMKRT